MVYFDRREKIAAIEEFDAADDGEALKLASGRGWSGSYEIQNGSRAVYAHIGSRLPAGR
jgi:hypothetical protein